MLFARLVVDKIEIADKNRFYLGSIIPDAYMDPSERKIAHFIKHTSDESFVYFDFTDFETRFHNKILSDDMYLGYYAHLVEDALYRYYLYYEKDLLTKIKSYKLDILHKDYHILNSYITRKYDLPKQLEIPDGFYQEMLNDITKFDYEKIICDYSNDLLEMVDEKTVLLTEEMLEEFILK